MQYTDKVVDQLSA